MSVLRVRRAVRPSIEAYAPGCLNATTMREIKELPDYTRSKGLDCQHNFANMSACLHAPMRIRRLFERESAVHDGFDAAFLQQRHHLGLDCRHHCRLIRIATGAQGRAGMCETLDHQPGEIDGGLGRAEKRDLYDTSIDRRSFIVARDIVAADHVEDDVRTRTGCLRLDRGDEILGL